MRRAAAAAVTLLLLSCSSSDDASDPFPDGDGAIVLPTIPDGRVVRFAMADVLDEDVHTYLRGGAPVVVYGDGDDLVFVQRSPADSVADVEPDGWQPFVGWPSLAEGERYLLRRVDGEVVFGWRRGATDADVETAVAGSTPAGFEVVGELPAGWKQALDGPQYVLSGRDRGDWHIALRRSPPSEQAAFRALLKDASVTAEFTTRASVDLPMATTPTRRVEVDGRPAMVGPLDEDVRVLVVGGDPGLTVLTTGARASTALTDDELVVIAEGVRTADRGELDAWAADRRTDEEQAERDALEEIGDILLEVERGGRTYVVVRFDDGSLCLSDGEGSSHCQPADEGPLVARLDGVVVGVVIEHSAVSVQLPDGTVVTPEPEVMEAGGAIFFVDVSGVIGRIAVTVDAETFEV